MEPNVLSLLSKCTEPLFQWLRDLFQFSREALQNEGSFADQRAAKANFQAIANFSCLILAYIQELYPVLIQFMLYARFVLPRLLAITTSISIRTPLQLSIVFEDVLARTHGLPYHYFRHWPTFRAMLEGEFRNCPGEEEVSRGQYRLMDSRSKEVVLLAKNWEETVFPGTKILMAILVRHLNGLRGPCPRIDCPGNLEVKGLTRSIRYVPSQFCVMLGADFNQYYLQA